MSVYSNALATACLTAFPCADASHNTNIFAGTLTKIYLLTSASLSFSDVSGAAYGTNIDIPWNAAIFGTRVLFTNYIDRVQSYVLGSSAVFADLSVDAPKAQFIAVSKNFVILGNTVDGTFGTKRQRVWWSGIGDPTSWPTPGTSAAAAAQSDYQDLAGDGGQIQGLVGGLGTADFAVFMERRIYRAQYIGSPAVFQFDPVEGARGTNAPGSIAQLGAVVFYLGDDGFYAFDGTNSTPIGFGKVDKFFLADYDATYKYKITAAIDPLNKVYAVAYPRAGSGGVSTRVLFYNWALSRWSYADFTTEVIFRASTFGYSMEGLDAVSASLDALEFSLDSEVWTGGALLLGAFDTSHKLNYFNGANIAGTLTTAEFTGDGGQRASVTNVIPLVDGGTITVALGTRENQTDSVTFTSARSVERDGTVPFGDVTGRYIRAKVNIPAGSTWANAMGVDPAVVGVGRA